MQNGSAALHFGRPAAPRRIKRFYGPHDAIGHLMMMLSLDHIFRTPRYFVAFFQHFGLFLRFGLASAE